MNPLLDYFLREIDAEEAAGFPRLTRVPDSHVASRLAYYYRCRGESREFLVHVDYGGRGAQLRYCVAMPEFPDVHPLNQFRFERALGFGLGDWDYIVEENVDDVMALFADVVRYCVTLPDRIRTEAG